MDGQILKILNFKTNHKKGNYKMRKVIGLITLGAMFSPAAAWADEYNGAYVVGEVGGNVVKVEGTDQGIAIDDPLESVMAGVAFGYRATLGDSGRLVIGLEGGVDFVTKHSDWRYSISAIGGVRTGERGLVYLRAGYGQFDGNVRNIEGIILGGGYEFGLGKKTHLRFDYRFLNYKDVTGPNTDINFKGHEFTVGLVFNF